jgi:hypothetical protein
MDTPRSQKVKVVEYLYKKLKSQKRTIATLDDVRDALIYCAKKYGLKLKSGNPANFMKDLLRGKNASRNWPESLKRIRIGGRQRVGRGRALEFVPYAEGQTDPFDISFSPSEGLQPIPLESISMPLASKRLGRKDESWLIQVAVQLRVIEHHFATRSTELKIVEISLLQIGVKLGSSEVDALFLATVEKPDGERVHTLITCEAKQDRERIGSNQIIGQIVAANRSVTAAGLNIELIVPIAVQAVSKPPGCIFVAQFRAWSRKEAEAEEENLNALVLVSEGLYQLSPPVPGVGVGTPQTRRAKKSETARQRRSIGSRLVRSAVRSS